MSETFPAVAGTDVSQFQILVEWSGGSGIQRASRTDDLDTLKARSQHAIELAMQTIQSMAHQVARAMKNLGSQVEPDEAEVEFGINLDVEAGAVLAKATAGAQITVTLKWTAAKQEKVVVLSDRRPS